LLGIRFIIDENKYNNDINIISNPLFFCVVAPNGIIRGCFEETFHRVSVSNYDKTFNNNNNNNNNK
jgi:hypothetical protein